MKHRAKKTLRELTTHFGVKVKYVGYFDAKTHGKLMPREKIILINAHESRPEHVFTLLHELGHYVLHVLNPYRKFHPRWCDLNPYFPNKLHKLMLLTYNKAA
jgi:Zn-dependent peptidase ImmA (M78 family)